MKALYQEWFEYYVMKSGERIKQEEIDAEVNQHHYLSEENLKRYRELLTSDYVRKFYVDDGGIIRQRKK